MSQMSMFDTPLTHLKTYKDIDTMLELIREGETDEDLFSYNEITGGRSYSFYGTKVFEFCSEKDKKQARIKVAQCVLASLGQETTQPFAAYAINSPEDLSLLMQALRERKRYLRRNLISETFACCNDFMRCSDAGACIHQEDRFFNGCTYRQNLEQGRVFYGPNRNID